MNEEEANRLLLKYRHEKITGQELEQLLGWLQQYRIDSSMEFSETELENVEAMMWQAVTPDINGRRNKFWIKIAAAAVFVLAAGLAVLLYTIKYKTDGGFQKTVVLPGTNKAVLLMASGNIIPLSEQKTGLKINGNKLSYNDDTKVAEAFELVHSEINTLQVPKGGQYQATLSDGTRIWLNAASSLKFPSRFSGTNRIVELQGEGYFEVARAPEHPFIVKTNRQEVKVLGTHFNINAYIDEPVIATTLIEGSVQVNTSLGNVLLKPAQQSVLSNSGIHVLIADVNEATAWKNGEFVFNEENLESILRKVSRWYDVDVIFKNESKKKVLFAGSVTRFSELNTLLDMLERTKLATFKLEGRNLIVL